MAVIHNAAHSSESYESVVLTLNSDIGGDYNLKCDDCGQNFPDDDLKPLDRFSLTKGEKIYLGTDMLCPDCHKKGQGNSVLI